RQVLELGRADESEIGRVEHDHGPLALQVGVGDFDEFAVVVGGGPEGLDFGVDDGHGVPRLGWQEKAGGTGVERQGRRCLSISKIDYNNNIDRCKIYLIVSGAFRGVSGHRKSVAVMSV